MKLSIGSCIRIRIDLYGSCTKIDFRKSAILHFWTHREKSRSWKIRQFDTGLLCSKYSVFQNKNRFLFHKHLNMIITVLYYDSRWFFVIFL